MSQSDGVVGRRAFLTRGVVGGAGVALLAEVRAMAESPTDTCDGSLPDALILFMSLLIDVQGKAYVDISQLLYKATNKAVITLDDLADQLDLLEKQICQPTAQARVQQMRGLVEASRANARLLKSSARGSVEDVAPLVASLSAINEEVAQAVNQMAPDCKFILTPDGQKTLKRIFAMVCLIRAASEETKAAQMTHRENANQISKLIDKVRGSIFDAAVAVSENDTGKAVADIDSATGALKELDSLAWVSPPAQNRTTAASIDKKQCPPLDESGGNPSSKSLEKVTKPHEVKEPRNASYNGKEGTPAEALTALLEGARACILKPGGCRMQDEVETSHSSDGQGFRFVQASARATQAAVSYTVASLLQTYCKPYTEPRRAVLVGAKACIYSKYEGNNDEAKKNRYGLLAWLLAPGYFTSGFQCSHNSPEDREKMLRALAGYSIEP